MFARHAKSKGGQRASMGGHCRASQGVHREAREKGGTRRKSGRSGGRRRPLRPRRRADPALRGARLGRATRTPRRKSSGRLGCARPAGVPVLPGRRRAPRLCSERSPPRTRTDWRLTENAEQSRRVKRRIDARRRPDSGHQGRASGSFRCLEGESTPDHMSPAVSTTIGPGTTAHRPTTQPSWNTTGPRTASAPLPLSSGSESAQRAALPGTGSISPPAKPRVSGERVVIDRAQVRRRGKRSGRQEGLKMHLAAPFKTFTFVVRFVVRIL